MGRTYTFAKLEVSEAAYREIAAKLREAGYDHAFVAGGAIDMTGIALTKTTPEPSPSVLSLQGFKVKRLLSGLMAA